MRIGVTDHAIVRYLERVEGRDIETIKKTITAEAEKAYPTLGDGEYPIKPGCRCTAVVRNSTVVTIRPE
jgi:hypothetical protein